MTTSLVLLVSLQAVLYVQSAEVQHLLTGVNYLQKYGYMDPPDPNANALITEIDLRQSIMKLQRFFHLPQTGEIDAETARMMETPRCGLPDLPQRSGPWSRSRGTGRRGRRYLTHNIRWDKNDLTYSFDNYTPDLPRAETRDALRRAFQTWSDVTPLTFREIQGRGINPDIHIQFTGGAHGDGYSFDGEGGTLAHAFFPGAGIGGDAHFDDAETFTFNKFEGTDLFTVAAHELGHSLGLGHSDVPGALMAPYYQGFDPNFLLHNDDILGIQSLYGPNSRPPPRPRPRPTQPPQRPDTPDEEPEPAPTPSVTCTGKFSAVSDIRGEVFIFKGEQMWRLATDGRPLSGYPMPTSRFWRSAPYDADAVFEKLDGTIVFVKGTDYWEFNGLSPKNGFPQYFGYLTEGELAEVDAVLALRKEAKTYFFKGDLCWRYDGMQDRMEEGYPKLITDEWIGGPESVDAAFRFNGASYLVQGNRYWKFSGDAKTADSDARWFTVDFLECSEDTVITDDGETDPNAGFPNSATRTFVGLPLCVLSALVALLFYR